VQLEGGGAPNVSEMCYYAYRLHPKPGEQHLCFGGGNLVQQYVVDAWASIEQSNIKLDQEPSKVSSGQIVYSGLRDAAIGDHELKYINLADHGTRIILPSSHMGSWTDIWVSSSKTLWPSVALFRARSLYHHDLPTQLARNTGCPYCKRNYRPNSNAHRKKQTAYDRPEHCRTCL